MKLLPTVCGLVVVCALPAEAGLGSLLSKLGRGGRAASAASKTARVARVGKTAVVGVTTAVVAERAAASMARLGAEGAHVGYLAKGASGELLFATKATHGAPVVVDDLGKAVAATADGVTPKVLLDPSVAASPEALAKLPPDAELVLVQGSEQLPVRRVTKENGAVDFVVEHGTDLVDLAQYAADASGGSNADEDTDSDSGVGLALGLGLFVAIIAVWKWRSSQTVTD